MYIEETQDFSVLTGEALQRAKESVVVWRLNAGSRNGSEDHIVALFGVIATNAICACGFLWLELFPAGFSLTRGQIREAKRQWDDLHNSTYWTFVAFAEEDAPKACRFLRFLNFSLINKDSNYLYYEGPAKWQ